MSILILIALFSSTSIQSTAALAFSPQIENLKLPNFFNALTKATPPSSSKSTFTYTHLEGNGQLWQATTPSSSFNKVSNKVSIVIDPLASQLDFGIPWGYRANKSFLSESDTINIIKNASPTHCFLTMGLDDHTHLPTIAKLREACPDLKYIVAPSCEAKLVGAGVERDLITVLKHGESYELIADSSSSSNSFGKVTATEGALVGPPWQTRENGYLLEIPSNNNNNNDDEQKNIEPLLSIYYEPHADIVLSNLLKLNIRAKIMVSPVTKQSLPAQVPPAGQFTLVYGGDRTLEIAEAIGARVIVPLGNGVLDIEGPLASLVEASGDVADFESLVEERNGRVSSSSGKDELIRVEKGTPGVPLTVTI